MIFSLELIAKGLFSIYIDLIRSNRFCLVSVQREDTSLRP
jgi:hypothetical protein